MDNDFQIFISYRREGAETLAQSLHDRLESHGYRVFLDRENLGSGNFDEKLYARIAECTDILAVLPPNGLDRCSDPEDWVRKELAYALKLEKNIIPVMMEKFEFPKELPEDLAALSSKNGAKVDMDYFDAVIDKIIGFLHSKPLNGESSDALLLQLAANGDVQSINELGLRYEFGSETIDIDRRRAFECYQQAADREDPGGLYNLADVFERCSDDPTLVYDYGIKVSGSAPEEVRRELREKAIKYYEHAAESGFSPAIYRLANLAEDDHDLPKALAFYREAAAKGYPPAVNALGFYLINGIAAEENAEEAGRLFKQAADGYAPAAFNYARFLETRDTQKSREYYERITSGDNPIPQAAYSLAKLYEFNLNDIRKAADAYHKALYGGITKAKEDLERCWDKL